MAASRDDRPKSQGPLAGLLMRSIDQELSAPSFLVDPYPVLRRLQSEEPVHWCEPWNAWLLSRYEDVDRILRDDGKTVSTSRSNDGRMGRAFDHFSPSERKQLQPVIDHYAVGLLSSDPPDHTRLRGLIGRAFTPQVIAGLAPFIREVADESLDRLDGASELDLIEDFAYPLPARVLHRLIGFPDDDLDRVRDWADLITSVIGSNRVQLDVALRGQQGLIEARAYIRSLVEQRRHSPHDDIISRLGLAQEQLSEAELVNTLTTFLVGGHETTTALISSGLLALLDQPGEMARLRADPTLMEDAVEEFMRYESPVQRVIRFAKRDIVVGDREIRKDQPMFLMIGAANRDPERFEDPERLDIGRRPNRHLGFVMGLHHCTGAPLARLQAAIAIPAILDRYDTIRSATDTPEWYPNHTARRLLRMPLIVTTGAARSTGQDQQTGSPQRGGAHDIGLVADFDVGTMRLVDIAGASILVANVDGRIHALQGTCSHEDYPLDDGELEDQTVTCGLHYSRFDLRDGSVIDPPAESPLVTHQVTIRDGRVFVRLSPAMVKS